MAYDKSDALDMLRELAELVMLDEGDVQSFRVRAYESALHAVEGHAGDIFALSQAELKKIPGIGDSTAAKIRELRDTGRVARLDELRAKHPASVVALLRIQGLGPKAVARLRKELGICSIDDLRRAIAEQKLRSLKGFGQKSEEKLATVLARLSSEGGDKRTPISVALPLAERICRELGAIPGVRHAGYCGSLRRFCETVGDLDVVVATLAPAPVMAAFLAMTFVDHVLAQGETKCSIVTRRGMQVDLRVVLPEQLGAAMLYFTGSKGHNIKLRQRALEQGMTLNEYALEELETKKVVAQQTEEEIDPALGLAWIHPVLREDMGEIELAARGALPAALDDKQMVGDFHVHTTLSGDGRSSLEAMVSAARARGYSVLAITEHAEGTVSGVARELLGAQREKVRALQKEIGGDMTLLHGVELNVGKNGELDYDLEFRREFDFCLASIHDHFELDREQQTRRVVQAMEDPTVHMIGHLSARMIGGRPPIAMDIDSILGAAERTGTALEVNGGLPRLDLSVDVLRRARDRDVKLVLTSDAHHDSELGRMRFAALNAMKAGVAADRIVNTWSRERVLEWVGADG